MSGVLKQNLTCENNTYVPNSADILKCVVIIVVMLLIIIGNICCLAVFNGSSSSKTFGKRMRYMMNSLCCTDLSIGLLVCPSTIYPSLYHCWPPGETMCKIEALLLSALFHESTLNMLLIAIDRYFLIHKHGYNVFMNSRRFLFVILGTWVVVFTTYAIVIFAGNQYYYDVIGINCEPFYETQSVTLTVISIFYFIPAVVFVFCYVSIYRTATKRNIQTLSTDDKVGQMVNANIRTSKYLAAITAGFFFAITPWTLCTLIIVAANVKLNIHLDFAVTWLAISNSFWNCLIYGVMNRRFRQIVMRGICGRWIASVRVTIERTSKSNDEISKDFSDKHSTYEIYKKRQSQKHSPHVGDGQSTDTSCYNPSPAISRTDIHEDSNIAHDDQHDKHATEMASFNSQLSVNGT